MRELFAGSKVRSQCAVSGQVTSMPLQEAAPLHSTSQGASVGQVTRRPEQDAAPANDSLEKTRAGAALCKKWLAWCRPSAAEVMVNVSVVGGGNGRYISCRP